MTERKIVYVHNGEWPSPSPSVVFVTGAVTGIAAFAPAMLYVRNGSSDPTETIYRSIADKELPDGLTIERIGFGNRTPGHTAYFIEVYRNLGRLASEGALAAVITRNTGFLPYMIRLRARYKVPCYYEPHDFYGDPSARPDLPRSLHILRNRWIERIAVPRLDGVIALTASLATLFRSCYPDVPITVAHTGLLRVNHAEPSRRGKMFCYIGSLDRHKGVGTVLAALGRTADRDIRLLVVGGKSERERSELMEFARLVRAEGRLEITGWIHHADIGHYLDRCVAGIVPLADTPYNRMVTSPLKILDCFSRSLPVIASDLPTVREYVEDGVHGFLFRPDDPDAIAAAFDRFVAGNSFSSMSPVVEKHASFFLWERRAEKMLEFIRNSSR
jgi:glycosyltransferase involved in cell wall biosynthesis